jgi:hypothetical protein
MTWRLSDGTTVELGGKVEGPSLFAQELSEEIARGVQVDIWPLPDGWVDLDVNNAAILNRYLDRKVDSWKRLRNVIVKVRSRPDNIPALPPPPWANEEPAPAGAIH